LSRIDDLIDEHCPDGVEFMSLGEVGEFIRGNGLQKKDFVDEGFPCIHYGQIYTYYGTATATTKSFVAPQLAVRLKQAKKGDLVVTTTSENIEDVCTAVAWLGDSPIAIGGHSCVYRHTLDPMYAAYYFQTEQFEIQKRRFVSGTKVKDIKVSDLGRIKIPVPPLAIQREIAEILSKMEALKSELESELEYRSRQYAYYRDSLLTFTGVEGVRRVTFGEVATIVRGGSPRPIQAFFTDAADGVNWIKIGDVVAGGKYITSTAQKIKPEGTRKSRRVEPGDFVLSNSMSFGRPYIMKIDGCIHDGWLAIKNFDSTFVPDFLYHLLRSTPVYSDMASKAGAGTVQNLNADIVKALILPAPDLSEQERIVAILDKFDALVNDLSIGLPAEIAARRQQYEYYRNKLLTFEEAA
jgi:type I restriction enzyme S subunit